MWQGYVVPRRLMAQAQSRPFDRGAQAGERVAQILVRHVDRRGKPRGQRGVGGRRRLRRRPARQRRLAQREAADRAPAEEPVDPLEDHRREVLDFDGDRPLDTQHESGGFGRLRIAAARPFHLHRLAMRRDFLPDDRRPMGDELGRRETLPREGVGKRLPHQISERAGLYLGLVHGPGLCHRSEMTLAGRVIRAKRGAARSRGGTTKRRPGAAALLAWYDRHRRKLPWRAAPGEAADPYRVWLSEIMLQQTTVRAVAPYYARFLARFPTLERLAAAPLDDVLKAWAGLGYYARARHLHACARAVTERGRFPDTEEALRALPGIGAYTAAAVAAIAFDRRASPVDGNVERVVARLYAVGA